MSRSSTTQEQIQTAHKRAKQPGMKGIRSFGRRGYLVLALVAAISIVGFQTRPDDDLFTLRKNFEIFGALYEKLVLSYVDDLDAEKTMNRGISAMLSDLDPYTVYSDQSQQVSFAAAQRGYVKAGINIGMINGRMTVLEPATNASAYKQGVKIGDVVSSIGGRPTTSLSLGDVETLLHGQPGSTISIAVVREGSPDPIEFVLTRTTEPTASVPLAEFLFGDDDLGIGYIKLTSFQQDSHREFRRAFNDLKDTGNLNALVIDLRDNLGGYVDAAVAIVEMLVPRGSTVLTMRGRTPDTVREYQTALDPIDGEIPVIVLMNSLSASASEILAGAVQDLDRGVVVGTTSFGKGLVQTVHALPHNSALKLTIARYFTPSGRSIQAIDYRAHDGSPTPVPDSLRTAYKTANGRIVKDGRGIEPDVTSRDINESEIEQALVRQSAFFFFANSFAAKHSSIEVDFKVDDETYAEFKSWLAGNEFDFRSTSDDALDELAAAMQFSGYGTGNAIEEMSEQIRREKERDLDRYRDRLEIHLRDEIAARFFESEGLIRSLLHGDPDIATAMELVRDRRKYDQLLRSP